MSASAVDVLLGTELPQIIHAPPEVASYSLGEDAIDLANTYMFDEPARLSPSQELRLRNGMATRADGKWAAARVGDFGGRQGAGKTDTIIARILAGVMLLGERLIIYTAHEFPTANEIFIRLGSLFENWDDLGHELVAQRRAHGDQGFELTDGRRILIKTRTGKSGRGFAKADLLIYDEAQHLQPEHVAGSGPAKLAHPNPQSWYAGSGGLSTSTKAWEMRRQALLGTGGRLSYTEHTAQIVTVMPDGRIVMTDPDPEDPQAWARANPGLGRWVSLEGMDDMRAELGSLFPREGLCVWEPEDGTDRYHPIGLDVWATLANPHSTPANDPQWALVVTPDRKWASIGLAGRNTEGRFHVEWVHHRAGTAWIVDTVAETFERRRVPIRIHKSGPEGSFIAPLRERGVEVVEVSSSEVAQATGQFIDAATSGQLVHLGQPSLDKALSGAEVRMSTDGAMVWSQRSSSVEITPLLAVTVALGGVPAQTPVFSGNPFTSLDDWED